MPFTRREPGAGAAAAGSSAGDQQQRPGDLQPQAAGSGARNREQLQRDPSADDLHQDPEQLQRQPGRPEPEPGAISCSQGAKIDNQSGRKGKQTDKRPQAAGTGRIRANYSSCSGILCRDPGARAGNWLQLHQDPEPGAGILTIRTAKKGYRQIITKMLQARIIS